jgi:hypothetical protein
MYASGPRRITSASPRAGVDHCGLFRARWPSSAPCSPVSGSKISGSVLASRPASVEVTRSAAVALDSSARTSSGVAAKWPGMYTGLPPQGRMGLLPNLGP